MAARQGVCGFELNGTAECGATGGTAPTISSAQAYSGTYSCLVDRPADTTTSYIRVGGFTAAGIPTNWSMDQAYIEFRIRIDTLPGTAEEIAEVMNTSDALKCAIRVTSTGKLQLFNSGGTTQIGSDGATTLNTATWYRIGIFASNGTSTKVELRLNGSPEVSSTSADLGATNVGYIRLGKVVNRNSGALKAYYDDVICDSTEWPGDTKLEFRQPDAVGTFDEYTASTGTKVACVADLISDGTTDYIYDATATGDQTFTFPDLSANCTEEIVCQQVIARCAENGSNTSAFGLTWVCGGTQYSSSTSDPGTSAVTRSQPRTWNPYYQRYWSKTEANAVEVGVINRAAKQINTYQLGIYTEYRVGATATRPSIKQFFGFERGDGEDIYSLSGTYSVQGTTKITGNYTLKCNPTTTGTSTALIYQSDWSDRVVFAHPEMFLGFMMRITTLPGGTSQSEEIAGFETSVGGAIAKLRITSEGKLAIYDSSNTIIGSAGSTTLSTGTDYHISLGVHIGSSGAYSVKINGGANELSGTANFGTTNIGVCVIGKRTNRSSQAYEIYFDDVVCSPTTHPKSTWRVKRLGPDGNGTYTTNWSSSGTPGGASLYNFVDEVPNDAGDYAYSATNLADFSTTLGSCSGAGIDGSARCLKMVVTRKANASTATSRQFFYRNSHSMRSNTQTDSTSAVTWGFLYEGDFGADGGLEWTTTVLDALEVGIRCSSTNQINVESFDCQVLYDAPSGPQSATAGIATATATALAATGANPYAATAGIATATAAGLAATATNPYNATAAIATATASALAALGSQIWVAGIATATAAGLAATGANPYTATAQQATAVASGLAATGSNPYAATAAIATATATGLAATGTNPYATTAGMATATAAALAATAANPYAATAAIATATATAFATTAEQAQGPQYATAELATATASGLAATGSNPYAATAAIATATAAGLAATGANPYNTTAQQATATATALAVTGSNPYAATAAIATATATGFGVTSGQVQPATAEIATATASALAATGANPYNATAQQATATATALAATGSNPYNATAQQATATAAALAATGSNPYAATAAIATATATGLSALASQGGTGTGPYRSADLDFLETMYFDPDSSMTFRDRAILSGVYAEITLQDTPEQMLPIPEEIGMRWGL